MIKQTPAGFFIHHKTSYCDKDIAEILNLDSHFYQRQLKSYGAKRNRNNWDIFFSNLEDAEKAMEWIDSIQLMETLVK
jgi:hypothetical protein